MPHRLPVALFALALAACNAQRFAHPAVVPTSSERVALAFPGDVLYVLDGHILPRGDSASVPNAVRDLDPATIEHIEVLKGATARRAYSDAGSSGGVIITTKTGARPAGPRLDCLTIRPRTPLGGRAELFDERGEPLPLRLEL